VNATTVGEAEYYTFSVVDPGDVATIYATAASGFTPFVSIYSPDGTLLGSKTMTSASTSLGYTFATPANT